jgi:hypothetical protein
MGTQYILLSNREIKKMHSFLRGDLRIIKTSKEMKNRFNPFDYLQFQTLQEREILRDCLKWILKFLKINITQMRILSY